MFDEKPNEKDTELFNRIISFGFRDVTSPHARGALHKFIHPHSGALVEAVCGKTHNATGSVHISMRGSKKAVLFDADETDDFLKLALQIASAS